jgi:hypothetical protein
MAINFGDAAIRDAIPVIFSAKVLKEIDDKLVFGKIATKEYQGEISEKGSRVVIRGIGDVTINEYDDTKVVSGTDAPVQYEAPKDSAIFLDVDKAYYYGIVIGDIKKKQSDINFMTPYAQKAGYGLDKKVDTFIADLYDKTAVGAAYVADASVDTTTVTSVIGELWDACEGVNIEKKFIVLPSWVTLKLLLAGIIHAQDLKGTLKNGFVGNVLGFDMYQSNRCHVLTTGTKNHAIMAGSYDSIAFVQQMIESESIRLETRFADAIRGLHVWGSRVIKPKELFYADMTYAVETKI